MEEAITALPGVSSLEADLKNDAFHVTYDAEKLSESALLSAIQSTGFLGKVVSKDLLVQVSKDSMIPWDSMPERIQDAASKAKDDGKLVLIDFHGPG